ncbi:MAG: DNA polymerase III subunit epsilon [Hyphomicrobiaceae bacterium]|nr:DNA polymerase III subunit epsilon [Hyphomicrobiaceae bacterium]
MTREIVLDTETTGLAANGGDRLVEIGCIELANRIATGRVFHQYLDPQRDMPEEAFKIHGLSSDFLRGKPLFADVVEEFLTFVGDATLVIHNASFDMGFINAELARVRRPPIPMDRVVDTLQLARRKHPGSPSSLDALCRRYQIDNSARTKHGALLDSELLAEVYVELLGERQATLRLASIGSDERSALGHAAEAQKRPKPLAPRLTPEEIEAHKGFVESLGDAAAWKQYLPEGA